MFTPALTDEGNLAYDGELILRRIREREPSSED
jgi:hypothetical protein